MKLRDNPSMVNEPVKSMSHRWPHVMMSAQADVSADTQRHSLTLI